MPRAICRCGHALPMPADPSARVICPGCGARVRIRSKGARAAESAISAPPDGVIRFFCPCGRRLKVDAASPPPFGKCPDCGEIVPVPAASLTTSRPLGHPEAPTDELPVTDREAIERWANEHRVKASAVKEAPPAELEPQPDFGVMATMAFTLPQSDKVEVGMRICPDCGQPVPMGAQNCRQCGAVVPKK